MNLRVAFEVSATYGTGEGGLCMALDWGQKAAERLRSRTINKKRDDDILSEKRRLLQEQSPALWIALCERVKKSAISLNENYRMVIMRVKDVVANRLEVRFEFEGRVTDLTAEFSATTSPDALKWRYSGDVGAHVTDGSCALFVKPDGKVVFQQTLIARAPESLADEMLDGLLAE